MATVRADSFHYVTVDTLTLTRGRHGETDRLLLDDEKGKMGAVRKALNRVSRKTYVRRRSQPLHSGIKEPMFLGLIRSFFRIAAKKAASGSVLFCSFRIPKSSYCKALKNHLHGTASAHLPLLWEGWSRVSRRDPACTTQRDPPATLFLRLQEQKNPTFAGRHMSLRSRCNRGSAEGFATTVVSRTWTCLDRKLECILRDFLSESRCRRTTSFRMTRTGGEGLIPVESVFHSGT